MGREKLYNVIFPIWAIVFMSPLIIIPLIGNLVIDGLVIFLTLYVLKTKLDWRRLRAIILKAWGLGFAADIVGVVILFFLTSSTSLINDYNPWENTLTTISYLTCIGVSGIIIFWGNYSLCLNEGIDKKVSRTVGIVMGILTAPWLFLIPTNISRYYEGM